MDYLTIGAFLFTSLFVVWGFFRGFWKSLAAVVSLILAYLASFLLAAPCAHILSKNFGFDSVNGNVLWGASGIVLFIVVGFVTRHGITLLGKALPVDNLIVNRSFGAVLNGGYGASLVVFIVWALAFSFEAVDGSTGVVKKMDVRGLGDTPKVVIWSRSIMAYILAWNARAGGASDEVAEVTKAFAENPTAVLGSVKSTLELPEFKALISKPELQELARNKDFEALKNSPEFAAFINHTAVAQLQKTLMPSGTEQAKAQVADYMLSVWHDIDFVKNDPEVMTLFEDPEIQSFLKDGPSKISLSVLSKGRDLMALISEKAGSVLPEEVSKELPPMPVVYKWYDDKGVLNVTYWDEVPPAKRDKAELVE